jgi:hypothetical protein
MVGTRRDALAGDIRRVAEEKSEGLEGKGGYMLFSRHFQITL